MKRISQKQLREEFNQFLILKNHAEAQVSKTGSKEAKDYLAKVQAHLTAIGKNLK